MLARDLWHQKSKIKSRSKLVEWLFEWCLSEKTLCKNFFVFYFALLMPKGSSKHSILSCFLFFLDAFRCQRSWSSTLSWLVLYLFFSFRLKIIIKLIKVTRQVRIVTVDLKNVLKNKKKINSLIRFYCKTRKRYLWCIIY